MASPANRSARAILRPSACNALDTLLVNQAVAAELLPNVAERLAKSRVALKADERALPILRQAGFGDMATPAGADDFSQEWLALILGVKIVDTLDEAIAQGYLTECADYWQITEHGKLFLNSLLELFLAE